MRCLFALIALTATTPVAAQVSYPPTVIKADLDQAQASANAAQTAANAAMARANQAMAAVPVAASAVPPTENVGGAVGTSGTYRPADAVQPRITRAAVVTTDASGNWAVTWTTALPTAPAVLLVPVNSSTQPVVCNVATRTTTSASGKCWLARTLPATITVVTALVNYDMFGGVAASTTVQVFAIPLTQ